MNPRLQHIYFFMRQNLEAFIWLAVLIVFATSATHFDNHFTFCPLKMAGFKHCPGCGLGRGLILLLHGHFSEAFNMHPLAFLALPVITYRMGSVFYKSIQFQKTIKQ